MHQADWIGPRLAPWGGNHTAAIVVPAGFAAYARVLHPAEIAEHGGRPVRWADVAAWSGMPLRPDAQFHSIALPPADPGEPPPYQSQGPREGSLDWSDAEVLAGILRDWTATPEDCWFCVWDGYGWETARLLFAVATSGTGEPPPTAASPRRGPVPGPVLEGPRVQLPNRSYLLYQGPAEAALTLPALEGAFGQCPNLWWPADRAWCVASEIDLPWTYIGGPRGLVDAILADDRIEALPGRARRPGEPGRGLGGSLGRSAPGGRAGAWHGLAQHAQGIGRCPAATTARDPPRGTAHRGHPTRRRFQQLPEFPRPGRGRAAQYRAPLPDDGRA